MLYLILFAIYDGFYNFTWGAFVFWEFGTWERRMLTMRLYDYIHDQPLSWRGRLATFICFYLIEPWDWNHCGLAELMTRKTT